MEDVCSQIVFSKNLTANDMFLLAWLAAFTSSDGQFCVMLDQLALACKWNWGKTRARLLTLRDQKKIEAIKVHDGIAERDLAGPLAAMPFQIAGRMNWSKF